MGVGVVDAFGVAGHARAKRCVKEVGDVVESMLAEGEGRGDVCIMEVASGVAWACPCLSSERERGCRGGALMSRECQGFRVSREGSGLDLVHNFSQHGLISPPCLQGARPFGRKKFIFEFWQNKFWV